MRIFEKEKYIETKYKPIHIKRLNEEKIPYVIRERRKITSIARLVYFCYSVVLDCLLYTSPSPRDRQKSRMPSSA